MGFGEMGVKILTFSYWGSFTLKTKVLEPAFSQNLNFYEQWLSSALPRHLSVQSIELPVCAPCTGSCCSYQPRCLCQLFETWLSP